MKFQISKPLFFGITFLLLLILAEFSIILFLNDGFFVYTIDDPYVHMALSENIILGHYGVNKNEFSSPSSSILWPFIVAPFANNRYFPLFFNIIVSMASIFVMVKILIVSFAVNEKQVNDIFISSTVILFILATNIVGLIFSGMEHSLQVFFVAMIAYGLIVEIEKNKLELWFLAAIVIAPLIRYENLAISLAAIVYLLCRKYFKQSISVFVLMFLFIGGFSFFLISLNLDLLPNSVISKSTVIRSGGKLLPILENIKTSVNNPQGLILSLFSLFFFSYLLYGKNLKKKQLAICSLIAILLHFLAGKFDWYHRYEIYIWSFSLLVFLFFLGPIIKNYLSDKKQNILKLAVIFFGFFLIIGKEYIIGLFNLPIASNNIYEQQYQMHRFAVEYYNMPIAVNDLGYTSYKNDNYVLDLSGLTSYRILQMRMNRDDENWMAKILNEKKIELAMIYEDWFLYIPKEWIKIGDLHLGKKRITCAKSQVAFFSTNQEVLWTIKEKLRKFIKTLPPDVKFQFETSGDPRIGLEPNSAVIQ